ncbi:unnamed protein product, partial [marine sediment metagenome]
IWDMSEILLEKNGIVDAARIAFSNHEVDGVVVMIVESMVVEMRDATTGRETDLVSGRMKPRG